MKKEIEEIVEELCLPNGEFPTKIVELNGYEYLAFDWGPKTLFEYFNLYKDHKNKEMIVYEDERWTYREAYEFSSAFANSLINDFGVKKGDRIAIASRNYPEWIFSFIAITSIGAIAVPMNSWWTSKELEYGIKDSESKILIVDEERLNRISSLYKKNNLSFVLNNLFYF